MKALVFHGIGDIRLDDVAKPKIRHPNDVIVKVTTSAICGTDLHFIRGTVGPMQKGTIIGHEAVGIVDEIGNEVRNFQPGDRVIVPSTIACGYCSMCRRGLFAHCNVANPNGPDAGTAFFGGPKESGPFQGCQTEFVCVPYGNHNCVKLPDEVSDDKAILLSDIFPTAYFGADIAKVKAGDVVVILGCGPVGQFAITSCKLLGASRIFAIDCIPSRLRLAQSQGAEVIDFNKDDPLAALKEATKNSLADVVIDAVGIDAISLKKGAATSEKIQKEFHRELHTIAPVTNPKNENWIPGNAPSQALRTAVDLVRKCGTLSIIGVYSDKLEVFPIGKAMPKNINIVMGNCHHRAYIPHLLNLVQSGMVNPTKILTQKEPLLDILSAYKHFDAREEGWVKVALDCMSS